MEENKSVRNDQGIGHFRGKCFHTFLYVRSDMRIPKLSNDDQKAMLDSMCHSYLMQYNQDTDNFIEMIVTGDERSKNQIIK